MSDIPHSELIREIEAFCAENGVTKTRFGRATTGDGSLVPDLYDGRELRRATLAKVRAFMSGAAHE
jgi:hypothetical protein